MGSADHQRLINSRTEWRPYCLSKAKLIMAAQRISASSVNWVEFARKIPAAQKASFQAFKQKSDGFVRAVNSLPEAAPKIDFATYKSKIAVPGMVDEFQKKYEALQIPYPKDNASSALDSQLVAKKAEYEKFVAASEAKIAEIQTELDKWEKMRPFTEMTQEELARQAPHLLGQLGIRDPVIHRKSFLQMDSEYKKFVYTETVDEWEARMRIQQTVDEAAKVEAEERARKEREKLGLDY